MPRRLLCLAAVGIRLAQGDVSFASQQVVADGSSVSSLVVADINNDGFFDVVPTHADSFDDFVWYRNEGGGAISSNASVIVEGDHQSAVVADLNQDGLADVIASSFQEQSLRWYRGVGAGLFGPEEIILSSADLTAMDVGDFDGDGVPDIVVSHWFDGVIEWYRNRGNGDFEYVSELDRDEEVMWSVEKVIAADLTGDGMDEVLAVSMGAPSNKISWYENLDGKSWSTEKVIALPDFSAIVSLRVADLNGDGYLDVVFASRSSVVWFKNNGGDGTFSDAEDIATVSSSSPLGAESISPGDLDGDGDDDLLVAAYNLIWWYENDGLGGFTRRGVVAQGSLPRAVDLTNDGNLDILATSPDRQVVWYRNQAEPRSVDDSTESVSSTTTSATSASTTFIATTADDGGADVGSSPTTTGNSSSEDEEGTGTGPQGPIISNKPSSNNGEARSPAAACLVLSTLLALAAL
jgi:hypothetical protein